MLGLQQKMKRKKISAFVELAFCEEDRQEKLAKELGMVGTFSAYPWLA